jgi:RNA polymerase-binding transcription factor DksA
MPARPVKKTAPKAAAKPAKATAAKKAAPAAKTAKRAGAAKAATPAKKVVPAKVASTKPVASKPATSKQAATKPAPAKRAVAPAKKAASPTPTPAKKRAPAKAETATPTKVVAAKVAPTKVVPEKKPRPSSTVICPLSGFEVKPDKANLAPSTVERLRALLVEERARHLHQADELLAEAEALATDREGGDTQFDEESGEGDTVNVERERDLLLSASARQIVDEIDGALERIAAGTYGLCVPAGRRISLERLEALPFADTCVDCKARAERRR